MNNGNTVNLTDPRVLSVLSVSVAVTWAFPRTERGDRVWPGRLVMVGLSGAGGRDVGQPRSARGMPCRNTLRGSYTCLAAVSRSLVGVSNDWWEIWTFS